jgi:hypothetical protein
VRPEGLGKLKKFNYLNGNRALELPASSIVPQPTTQLQNAIRKGGEVINNYVRSIYCLLFLVD